MRQYPSGTLTLLFTDIEGSTRLLQQLGSQYADMLQECRRLLRTAFQQCHGYEVDTQGDAFFVVFERARDAVDAAIAAQRALFHARWPCDVTVRVRMGIHTGEPQVVEEGYVGMDVHRAARIMSAAHGGQVLLSQATCDLVAANISKGASLLDLGKHWLKDIAGHSRLFQLVIQDVPSAFPPPSTLASRHPLRHLPSPTTSFVGREQEIATLCKQLSQTDVRLLTLIGIAGVGKSRLALQVALTLEDQFSGRVCFVALERVRNEEEAASVIAQALGIQEEKGVSLANQVNLLLLQQSMLLVLDSFEHVLPARLLIKDLLSMCSGLKVLVTSRALLHLQAEHLFVVSPLPLPEHTQKVENGALLYPASVTLFVQRAQAVLPTFCLAEENVVDIADICILLDGIPLAIELAAAQTRYFSPQNLLARLEQGTIFLQGKAQDIPERQKTLRGAIAWGYDLLSSTEQCVFRRIAVSPGGMTVEMVSYVCSAAGSLDKDVLEVLESLIDKSMLQRQEDDRGGVRFWLLKTLREYALECLLAAGEADATQTAHSEYILSWIERIAPLLTGAEQVLWLDQLDSEYENVRVAFAWLLSETNRAPERVEQALRLCLALVRFWELRSYLDEGATFLRQVLACNQAVPSVLKAQALHYAGFLALMQGNTAQAEMFLHESQLLFRESGDKAAMANILQLQGNVALVKSNYKLARRLLEESLTLYQELGNTRRAASTRGALAQVAIAQGSYNGTLALLEENLAAYKALGDHYSTANPLYELARAHFLFCREQSKARSLAEESLALFRAVGNKRLFACVLNLLGQILYTEHEEDDADVMLEESQKLFTELGDRFGIADILVSRAHAATLRNEWKQARTLYEEGRAILQLMDEKELLATCLEGYGRVLVTLGEAAQAVQLWGTAAAIRAAIGAPMAVVYRSDYLQAVSKARASLNEDSFKDAWLEGSRPTLEHAEAIR